MSGNKLPRPEASHKTTKLRNKRIREMLAHARPFPLILSRVEGRMEHNTPRVHPPVACLLA
jgi:hypothetical protein